MQPSVGGRARVPLRVAAAREKRVLRHVSRSSEHSAWAARLTGRPCMARRQPLWGMLALVAPRLEWRGCVGAALRAAALGPSGGRELLGGVQK